MPAVSRRGDSVFSTTGSGYKCRSPMTTSIASGTSRVSVQGAPVARGGIDKVAGHPRGGCSPDGSLVISSGSRVHCNGGPAARIGDSAPSDNTIIRGATRVFFG